VRADTQDEDEALRRIIVRMAASPRLCAAVIALATRIDMLDALETAGYPVTNATIHIIVDGAQVKSAIEPAAGLQIKGGGVVPIRQAAQ
jgi:hypothetical protein